MLLWFCMVSFVLSRKEETFRVELAADGNSLEITYPADVTVLTVVKSFSSGNQKDGTLRIPVTFEQSSDNENLIVIRNWQQSKSVSLGKDYQWIEITYKEKHDDNEDQDNCRLSIPKEPPLQKEKEVSDDVSIAPSQISTDEIREVPRIYGLFFILACGVALSAYAAIKYYTRTHSSQKRELPIKKKKNAMENIKKAFTLGMYRPGTIIKTTTTKTTVVS